MYPEREYKYDFSMCSEPIELVVDNYDINEFFERLVGLVEPVDEEGITVECPYCGAPLIKIYPQKTEQTVENVYLGKEEETFIDLMEMVEELVKEGKFRTVIEAVQRYGVCEKCGNDYVSLAFVIPITANFDSVDELRKFYEKAKREGEVEYYFRDLEDVAFIGARYIYNGEEIWEVGTAPLSYGDNIEFTCVFQKLYDIVMAEE